MRLDDMDDREIINELDNRVRRWTKFVWLYVASSIVFYGLLIYLMIRLHSEENFDIIAMLFLLMSISIPNFLNDLNQQTFNKKLSSAIKNIESR